MDTIKLSLEQIRFDGGTQPRACTDFATVVEYGEAMERGDRFPPVSVMYDGTEYWLWDGFHRCEAAGRAGLQEIDCIVEPGTQTDAQWRSYAANGRHGLRRTNADKRRAVEAALRMRPELADRAIAEHVAVDHKTVGSVRAQLFPSGENPQSDTRIGRDGRVMDVSGINAGRTPQPESSSYADSMRASADKFKRPDPLPFEPKAAPPGGWPVAGEDGNFDDSTAECLVDAVAQRWCDIKILELQPSNLLQREEWIAAFSIGCKPCVYSEPLSDGIEEYDSFPTREDALREAAMRLAMYCWKELQDENVPKTAKEVLERFRLWALRTGEISEHEYDAKVRLAVREEEESLQERVSCFSQGITSISPYSWGSKGEGAVDDYERIAQRFVQNAMEEPSGEEAEALERLDDVLVRLTAFAAAVKAVPRVEEEEADCVAE